MSSLTSSPDSSPSPGQSLPLGSLSSGGAGQSGGHHHQHQHTHHQHHQQQQQLAAQQTKQTWQQLGQADFPMSPPVMNKVGFKPEPWFIWAPCHVISTAVLIGWDPAARNSPPPPAFGLVLRGRYWSIKVETYLCNPLVPSNHGFGSV